MSNEEALRITVDSLNKGKITEEMQDYRYLEAVQEALENAGKTDRPKGKWIEVRCEGQLEGYQCSVCEEFCFETKGYKVCPYCLADMRGETDD